MSKVVGKFAVHLRDDKGELHSFLPAAEVPGWAEKRMGAHCFEGGEELFHEDGKRKPSVVAPTSSDGPPPQAGRGSGHDKWADYAQSHGVEVDGLSREEIIAACEESGVPVE